MTQFSKTGVKIILILLLTGTSCLVKGSFDNAVHYSVNEGLPSAKVYDMLEDSRGYMWFATENGVSRFNGYQFENFTTENGLPGNSTLHLYEDNSGRIWFLSYQGLLSYFENGTVTADPANLLLNKINTPFFANIYIDSTGTKWLSPFNGGLIKQSGQESPEWIMRRNPDRDSTYIYLELKEDGHILSFFNVYGPDTLSGKRYYHSDNIWIFPSRLIKTAYHRGYLGLDSGFMLYFSNYLYIIREGKIDVVKQHDREIINVSYDNDHNLWVSEKFNGVFRYRGGSPEKPGHHYFKDLTVSDVIQDREGNHWFSTTENGVFFVPSLNVQVYDESNTALKNSTILALEMGAGQLFLSTDGKDLYRGRYSDNQIISLDRMPLSDRSVDNIYSLLFNPPNTLYATAKISEENEYHINTVFQDDLRIYTLKYGYHLNKIGNEDLVMAFPNGIRIIRKDQVIYNSPESFDTRIFVTEESPDSRLWLGTVGGLYVLKDDSISPYRHEDLVLGNRISVLKYTNNQLWVGSFDHGLAVFAEDSLFYLGTKDGLLSPRVKSILLENDSTVWVGTNRGLNRIQYRSDPFQILRVEGMDIWDGLPSNEINQVLQSGKNLWLATDQGLASFEPGQVRFDPVPPRLFLQHMVLEDRSVLLLDEPVSLEYDQNTLAFEFHGITFRNPDRTRYYYRLKGLNDEWSETNFTSVRFHQLHPGKYTFELYAINRTGQKSETVAYPFQIRKHFTQTNLFRAGVGLSALLIVAGIGLHFYSTQKKRSILQRQIYLTEQKAMLAQMNPHFVFNALNSIQNFILEKDEKNATDYLGLFSALIRRVLDTSNKNYISLNEELALNKLYLELEKFRFEGKFNYTIRIEKNVNPNQITVPSMILQPYLENAIWHGLVPKNGDGSLVLEVEKQEPGKTVISITDNGIGREAAARIALKRLRHTPMGMKNVEERIGLLNKLHRTQMSVEVVDLYDSNKQPQGTRVVLTIPDV